MRSPNFNFDLYKNEGKLKNKYRSRKRKGDHKKFGRLEFKF